MLAAQSPSLSGRKPLHPMNQPATPITTTTTTSTKPKPKLKPDFNQISDSNKENVPPPIHSTPLKREPDFQIESFDASLAEELSAIREKLERLRIDKEKTEKMLRERGLMLDLQMKETVNRGEVQKDLEVEVDRLYRLKEIRIACLRISSPLLRSLRDKEEEKKMKQDQLKGRIKMDEHKDERPSKSVDEVSQSAISV